MHSMIDGIIWFPVTNALLWLFWTQMSLTFINWKSVYVVSNIPSGSSLHPDLRGLSLPSSPSCTPNTPTMLCSGNSEPNLNTPLNINLNSSLNSNYHTAFSSSTGLLLSLLLRSSHDFFFYIYQLFFSVWNWLKCRHAGQQSNSHQNTNTDCTAPRHWFTIHTVAQ